MGLTIHYDWKTKCDLPAARRLPAAAKLDGPIDGQVKEAVAMAAFPHYGRTVDDGMALDMAASGAKPAACRHRAGG